MSSSPSTGAGSVGDREGAARIRLTARRDSRFPSQPAPDRPSPSRPNQARCRSPTRTDRVSDSCQITPTNADQRRRETNAETACSLPPDPSRPTRTTLRTSLQAGGRRFEPGTLHRMSSRVPDHGARIKAVETLLREGVGRVGEAEVVEPKIPRLLAEVQTLEWNELSLIFATTYAPARGKPPSTATLRGLGATRRARRCGGGARWR